MDERPPRPVTLVLARSQAAAASALLWVRGDAVVEVESLMPPPGTNHAAELADEVVVECSADDPAWLAAALARARTLAVEAAQIIVSIDGVLGAAPRQWPQGAGRARTALDASLAGYEIGNQEVRHGCVGVILRPAAQTAPSEALRHGPAASLVERLGAAVLLAHSTAVTGQRTPLGHPLATESTRAGRFTHSARRLARSLRGLH